MFIALAPFLGHCRWQRLHSLLKAAARQRALSAALAYSHPLTSKGGNGALLMLIQQCFLIFVPFSQFAPYLCGYFMS